MASGVLVDTINEEMRPCSPGSSDSDAVNTAAARVYFGPPHVAEKKYARSSNAGQRTPLRRSKRHSRLASVTPPRCLLSEDDEGTVSDALVEGRVSRESGTDTPTMLDEILEEPPSALAKRVLRASENPSPPPSPPLSPMVIEAVELPPIDAPLASTMDCPPDDDAAPSETITKNDIVSDPADSVVPELLVQHADPKDLFEEADLINFDSFSAQTPPAIPSVNLLPVTPPDPPLGGSRTVDDLLSMTPLRPLSVGAPSTVQDDSCLIEDLSHQELTPSAVDEAEVLIVLDDEGETEPSPAEVAQDGIGEPTLVQLNPDPHTPLRRSSRPRRSVSPYVVPLTGAPSPRKSALSVPTQSATGQSPIVGPARKKGSKRKDITVVEDDSEKPPATPAGYPATPSIAYTGPSVPHTPLAHRDTGRGRPTHPTHPQLRSLSPESTNVLMHLLPSTPPKLGAGEDKDTSSSARNDSVEATQLPDHLASLPSGSLQADSVVAPPSTPVRVPSVDISRDVGRTPARRVPIAEAFAQGSLSPHKPPTYLAQSSSLGSMSTPVFKPRAPEDIMRSPAKRVPVSEVPPSLLGKTPSRPSSPAKPPPRSMSTEPLPAPAPQFKRSLSAEPVRPLTIRPNFLKKPSSTSSISTSAQTGSTLPIFQPVQTIPEVDEAEPQVQPSPKKPPPASRLPTGKVESRIPRPGSKPYARPATSGVAGPSKLPAASRLAARKIPQTTEVSTAGAPRPMRMVRRVTKPVDVSSDSDSNNARPVAGPGPKSVANKLNAAKAEVQGGLTPTLKRKRDLDEPFKASPPGVKPVVLIRKVPPPPSKSMVTRPVPRVIPLPTASRPTSLDDSPGPVAVGKIRMRRVVDKKKSPAPSPATSTPPAAPPAPEPLSVEAPSDIVMKSPGPSSTTLDAPQDLPSAPSVSVTPLEPPQGSITGSGEGEVVQKAPSLPPPASAELEGPAGGLRRTSRARKAPQYTSDVFGPIIPTGRSQSRRRATIILSDNTPFSGMTALALKSLTNTNTLRNQKQIAELQTEIVKKEGKRPDSPTTRVRTTLEKQREERILERQARAERRARRSDSGVSVDENGEDESMEVDVEVEVDAKIESVLAPGDEEEWSSPERPAKRGRFEEGEGGEVKNGKCVKWNRGLATTVYIDDSLPNPKKHSKEDHAIQRKGCLAPSAKTLRLDTMGNVLNADAPVPNVVPESIVVKKFVYEDDAAPVPEPPPPPPQPKATRSRGKKSS